MSLGGESQTTQKSAIPKWLDKGAKYTFGQAKDFYNKDYKKYKGERVADFDPTQQNAFSSIINWSNTADKVNPEAIALTREAATAPGYSYEDYGRIVDETGKLGSISDYINPNIANSLQPAIRDIDRAAATERARIGDLAVGAGAFGDARHGILEGTNDRNRVEAIGDLSYQANKDAFDTAMGLRSGDLSRFFARDTAQAAADEQALARKAAGAGQMSALDTVQQQNAYQKMMAALGVGNIKQQNAQSRLDTDYEAWQLKRQSEYDKLAALVSAVGGVPYSRTTTTTEPDNSGWGALGALAGVAIPGI